MKLHTSPMSPCTTRIGSTKMSLASLSIFFRKVALNRRAVKEIKCFQILRALLLIKIKHCRITKEIHLLCLSGRTWLAIDLTWYSVRE